jgi:hypothetical protein
MCKNGPLFGWLRIALAEAPLVGWLVVRFRADSYNATSLSSVTKSSVTNSRGRRTLSLAIRQAVSDVSASAGVSFASNEGKSSHQKSLTKRSGALPLANANFWRRDSINSSACCLD